MRKGNAAKSVTIIGLSLLISSLALADTSIDAGKVNDAAGVNPARSIDDFLTPDGHFDLDTAQASGYQESLDISGYKLELAPGSDAPIFYSIASGVQESHAVDVHEPSPPVKTAVSAGDTRRISAEELQQGNPGEKINTIYLSESFWTWVPAGWYQTGMSLPPFSWYQNGAHPYSGAYCAACEYTSEGMVGQEEFLQTPLMDLSTAGSNLSVSFYWKGNYDSSVTNNGSDLWLEISTDGSTFPTALWTEEDVGVFDTAWRQQIVSLEGYNLSTIKLEWRYRSRKTTPGGTFFIDSVEVYDMAATINVTTLADDGTGSLREAIELANSNPGLDTISFAVSGLLWLASALPTLTDDSTVILGSTAPEGAWSLALWGPEVMGDGLVIQSSDNTIEGLTIWGFLGNGITVGGAPSIRNKLTHNLIHHNGGLAIDLNDDSVTANDVGDGDTGPNELLNYPVIDSAVSQMDGSYIVYGTAPNSAIVEIYLAHPADVATCVADPSGHGEACVFVDSVQAAPTGEFNLTIPASAGHFSQITATARDAVGNTSEFCQNVSLVPGPLIVVAYSPVNIIITDPLGRRYGKDSLGNLIAEIPDGWYSPAPDDSVVISYPLQGEYIIGFVTEAGAPMGSTFSAIIQIDGSQQVSIIADQGVPASGQITSVGYTVEEGCIYKNGDANRDEGVNVGDAVFIISYVFKGGQAPDPVLSGDANCDAATNVGDAVYIISYVFKGGNSPCYFEP